MIIILVMIVQWRLLNLGKFERKRFSLPDFFMRCICLITFVYVLDYDSKPRVYLSSRHAQEMY
jgi:hypothetical protein